MENILVCIEIDGQDMASSEPRYSSFAEFNRYHRRRLNWSQDKFAEEAEIGQSYVSGLERGINKDPNNEILTRIAAAIHRPLEEVFAAAGKVYKGSPLPPGTELRTLPSGRQAYITTPSGDVMDFTPEDIMDIDLILDLLEKRKQRP
jgi:transcriptional regulator with XRE-family HTH domain